jgi:molecular chaperone DnaK (HSP70)
MHEKIGGAQTSNELIHLGTLASNGRNGQPLVPRAVPVRVIGIDLGTTNSTVAEIKYDPASPTPFSGVRCLEIDQQTTEGRYTHFLVPSVIAHANGTLYTGEGAKRLRAQAGELGLEQSRNIFSECKNDMGTKRTYHRAPEGFRSAAEIGGHVLRFLKQAVQDVNAHPVDRYVVTVPASFQTSQRHDTMKAAELAGISLHGGDLLDEPVAAFLDYLLS